MLGGKLKLIISRTPLRVSLFGGGTDMPEFYEEFGGAILSFPINKYVYVTSHRSFDSNFRLAYSEVEVRQNLHEIRNPIIRECLIENQPEGFLEITSIADVPANGTGLASSSAFTISVLSVLKAMTGEPHDQVKLAEDAFHIERNKIGDPVGKQDHYGTALGGLKFLEFEKSGRVLINKIETSEDIIQGLFSNLLIVYTGTTRSAKKLLLEQQNSIKSRSAIRKYINSLDYAYQANELIIQGNYEAVGRLLSKAWESKKGYYSNISTPFVDQIISTGIKAGALGGKLLGAGTGGFVLFFAPRKFHEGILSSLKGLKDFPVYLDASGTQIIYKESNE